MNWERSVFSSSDPVIYYLLIKWITVYQDKDEITNILRHSAAATACLFFKKHRPGEEKSLHLKDFDVFIWDVTLSFEVSLDCNHVCFTNERAEPLHPAATDLFFIFMFVTFSTERKSQVASSWQHRQLSVILFLIFCKPHAYQRGKDKYENTSSCNTVNDPTLESTSLSTFEPSWRRIYYWIRLTELNWTLATCDQSLHQK